MNLICTERFTHGFFVLCTYTSGTELYHVRIGNTANNPNKVTRHAVYSQRVQNVYTYFYTTAANQVHLPTKFMLH